MNLQVLEFAPEMLYRIGAIAAAVVLLVLLVVSFLSHQMCSGLIVPLTSFFIFCLTSFFVFSSLNKSFVCTNALFFFDSLSSSLH